MMIADAEWLWGVPPFVFLFPALWCFVAFIIARSGGWNRLAERHSANGRKPPRRTSSYYLLGGELSSRNRPGAQYKGTLILTPAPEGIHLKNMFLFRPFHPPLLLPWSGVRAVEQRKGWFGGIRSVLVFEDDGVKVEVFLDSGAANAIRRAAGPYLDAIDRPPPLLP